MKVLFFIFGFVLFFYSNSNAQWINCESNLYIENQFEPLLVDTVKFGENFTSGNNFQELFMNVYEPKDDTSSYRPAIVLAFGGSYIQGAKEDVRPICEELASKGYVCAAIDYRLIDAFVFPDSVIMLDEGLKARADMIAAIKYLRWDADNDNKWRINPDYIFVGGVSSGSITALMTTYFNEGDSSDVADWMKPIIENNGSYEGDSHLEYTKDYSYKVSGVSNFLGATVDIDFVDEGEPMVVGIHGTADDVVPYGEGFINFLGFPIFKLYGSQLIHERALEQNIQSSFISVAGGGHGEFLQDENLPWLDSIINTTVLDFHNYVLCPETSGVNELSNEIAFNISPNPASDFIKIGVPNQNVKSSYFINVYGIDGKLKKSKLISDSDNYVDISNFNTGMFIIKINDRSGKYLGAQSFIKKL